LKKSLIFSFSLIGQIGFATALPLVIFGLAGRYLDRMYGTKPIFLLIGFAVATVIVYFYLRKIVKESTEKFKKL